MSGTMRFFTAEGWRSLKHSPLRVAVQGSSQNAVEEAKTRALGVAEKRASVLTSGQTLDQALEAVVSIPEIFTARLDWKGLLVFWDRDDTVYERVTIDLAGLGDRRPEFLMRRRGTVCTRWPKAKGQSVTVIAPTAHEAEEEADVLIGLDPQKGLARVAGRTAIQVLYVTLNKEEPLLTASPGWPAGDKSRIGPGTIHQPLSS